MVKEATNIANENTYYHTLADTPEKREKLQKLMADIYSDRLTLSYSALKNFAKSPRDFIKYKLKSDKQTDAMRLGSLLDCLVTEPENFDKWFIINTATKPGGKGGDVCDLMLDADNPMSYDDACIKVGYSRMPNQKVEEKIKNYVAFFTVKAKGRIIVTQEEVDSANKEKDMLYSNKATKWLLERVGETQVPVYFLLDGFFIRGYLDFFSGENNIIVDLKRMHFDSVRKLKFEINKMRYNWQGALYNFGNGGDNQVYVAAINKDLDTAVVQFDQHDLDRALKEVRHYISEFKRCKAMFAWEASHDFFAPHGIYSYSTF